ncbi:GNAT family N-acetyltransferase [Lentilactobacillus farraginis]|uniref:Acetyltransferase, GNAT family n=1 Tax=Lentilactobacillus farraginis DSM 18382 = JCM 14108 TaxID=1423743 RepID=X0P9Y3_9LACO|nr:GNAT family N-acetyltransferase [Lentilactobacillus farraginis]GAF36084.1 acetyltransferase, GNAT family [Lentilactobacillus farraginis DSM 18382 = JCM 14108]
MENVQYFEFKNQERMTLLPLLLVGDEDKEKVMGYLNLGKIFVAKIQSKIVAALLMIFDDKGNAEIKNISVLPKYQGNGIGTQLISFVVSKSPKSLEQLIVGTGDADIQNIYFYLKNGFRFYGIRKNFSKNTRVQ